MNRRTAIFSGLGVLAAGIPLVGRYLESPIASDVIQAAAQPMLLSLIAEEEDVLEIGEGGQTSFLGTSLERDLVTAILKDIPAQVYQPLLQETTLKLEIAKKIRTEFQQGQTEVVKGWILSRTEVAQCRLYRLLLTESAKTN